MNYFLHEKHNFVAKSCNQALKPLASYPYLMGRSLNATSAFHRAINIPP